MAASLAYNLLRSQLDAVFAPYGEWFDCAAHTDLRPFDKKISFNHLTRGDYYRGYVFKVDHHGEEITVIGWWRHGEYLHSEIDANGKIGSMGEYQEIVTAVTHEVWKQLKDYADGQNFPCANILLYPEYMSPSNFVMKP